MEMKKEIIIEGMSCGHCSARVEKTLAEVEGVEVKSVDLGTKTATVEVNDQITDALLKETIEDVGYDVIEIK